ncbi:hypothetical protein [Pseudonocardia lacus]|uniref:hypothetical protein n=1 Tax=Pseudonocardia lacus TaxID=2835865 RepID=UPI001BDD9506|nr:hypothetical protein [Pseudonocardia lacus]
MPDRQQRDRLDQLVERGRGVAALVGEAAQQTGQRGQQPCGAEPGRVVPRRRGGHQPSREVLGGGHAIGGLLDGRRGDQRPGQHFLGVLAHPGIPGHPGGRLLQQPGGPQQGVRSRRRRAVLDQRAGQVPLQQGAQQVAAGQLGDGRLQGRHPLPVRGDHRGQTAHEVADLGTGWHPARGGLQRGAGLRRHLAVPGPVAAGR